jgi:hypothetical protein
MIHLTFPDGTIVSGATYRDAEDTLRATQWSTYTSRREFRREMRHRATLWGSKVSFRLVPTSKLFLHSLADAGVLRIDKSSTEGKLI